MTCTLPTPVHVRFLRTVPIRDNLSRGANRFGQISLLPIKMAPDTIHNTRLTDPRVRTQLLSRTSQWNKGRKPSSWQWPTTRFTEPISPACDRYIQYLLMGANRTVLNWHRRGLQHWRCRLTTYPLHNLPNQLSPLSPSDPARSSI
jgi:hypothetical protein